MCERDYILNHSKCACEIGKSLKSIIDATVVTCDEIIDAVAKS